MELFSGRMNSYTDPKGDIPVKKRTYRATEVKKVGLPGHLEEKVAGLDVVFSIDVAKTKQYGALLGPTKEVLQLVKWDHSETHAMIAWLQHLPAVSVTVALEPSGSYGDPLRYHLDQAGIPVCRVSPKRVKDYAEVHDGVPSTHDAKCSIMIGCLHIDGKSELWTERSDERRDLFAQIQETDRYNARYLEDVNRLEGLLARHWPELTGPLELVSATLPALLAAYGSPAAVSADPQGARQLMRRVGRSFLKRTKIDLVIWSASSTLGVPMTAGEQECMQTLASEVCGQRCRLNEKGKQLTKRYEAMSGVESLRPLLGKMTSCVVVSLADPLASNAPSSYVKALGLNLKIHSSGTSKIGQLRITKRGSAVVRRWLYMAVLRLVKSNPVVRAWYLMKVKRDGGRLRKKALVAVMRKLAKAIWHVARGVEFDAAKLFDVRKLPLTEDLLTGELATKQLPA